VRLANVLVDDPHVLDDLVPAVVVGVVAALAKRS
jgi:hypothetical protein